MVEATAASAADNLLAVIAAARAAVADGRFEPTDPPATWGAAATRLHLVLRAAHAAPPALDGGLDQREPSLLDKTAYKAAATHMPVVSSTPSAAEARRAVAADVAAKLSDRSVIVQSAGFQQTDDAYGDAARLVSTYGRPALAILSSNGKADAKVQGEIPALLLAMRSRLAAEIGREIKTFMGTAATEQASAIVALAESALCGDVAYAEAVRLLAGAATKERWKTLASGSRSGSTLGSTTGAKSKTDCQKAMGRLGVILSRLYGTAFGCPVPPATSPELRPDLGFSELAEEASTMSEQKVITLFEDMFCVARLDTHNMRQSCTHPLVDWAGLVKTGSADAIPALVAEERAEEKGRQAAEHWLSTHSPAKPGKLKPNPTDTPASPGDRPTIPATAKSLGIVKRDGETRRAFTTRVKQAEAGQHPPAQPAGPAAQPVAQPKTQPSGAAAAGAPSQGGKAPPQRAGQTTAAATPATLPLPPDSISKLIDKQGGGAVEILEQLHKGAAAAGAVIACSWPALTGSCRQAATPDGCRRCKSQTVPDAAFVAAVKAASTAALQAQYA